MARAVDEAVVRAAIEAIKGPDGRPLAIAGLSVAEGRVEAAIAIDPAAVMTSEPARRAAEAAVSALPGVVASRVMLTADRPIAPPGKPAAPPRPPRGTAIPGVERIVAVASGKGGVGKSTVTANLALALAAQGWRVGILDADIYGPSMPRLFGLTDKPAAEGRIIQPLQKFGLKIMSIGLLVAEDTAMIWRGPMVMSALNQLLREVAWGELDCLLVDMPPGTGDAQLTLAQSVPLAGSVIVSTPQDLALIDARRGITMFAKTAVPVLGLIENMSFFLCPHCGTRSDIFAHGGARHEAERLGIPFLGEVPLEIAYRESADAGYPVVAAEPDGPQAAVFRQIASAVRGRLEGGRRAPPRIVVEDNNGVRAEQKFGAISRD